MGRLSLCMIVRDEQEMLPDFLATVAGIWDELVVVDTGSRDKTITLLENAGACIHHFKWQDDFAAARNTGLEAATGEWILFLDADERITPELVSQIRTLLDDPLAGAATVVMRNLRPDGTRRDSHLLRLFRNDTGIRFEHRIHEDPSRDVQRYLARTGLVMRHLDGVVNHLGYMKNIATARGKKARDMDLLRRVLKIDPDDLYSWFKLMEQARFWNDERAWRTAAKGCGRRFEKALTRGLTSQPWADELTALLAQGLHTHPQKGLDWLQGLPDALQQGPAVQLRRGLWLEAVGNMSAAEQAFKSCSIAANHSGTDTVFVLRSALGLCRVKAASGDLEAAWSQAVQACTACPTDPEALLAAVGFAPSVNARQDWITEHLAHFPAATEALADTLQSCGLTDLSVHT